MSDQKAPLPTALSARPQRPRDWIAWRYRTEMRGLGRLARGEQPTTRGKPEKYTEDDLIYLYIEIEARARAMGLRVQAMLMDPRFFAKGAEAIKRRLNNSEKQTYRRLHSEGQRELDSWRQTRLVHRPGPHPKALRADRALKERISALLDNRHELFLLPEI